jgi:hypothetical protein
MHVGSAEPVALLGTGAPLWDLLDEPRTTGELARLLARDYGTSDGRILADIAPVLEELAARRLIVAL